MTEVQILPQILPVIMCGGAGTRLWPLSVPDDPKPFHRFGGEHTLFQQTVLRTSPSHSFLAPMVVCGAGHQALVEDQLAEIGIEPLAIVTEPVGRNTAAVAAIASSLAAHRAPGAVVLLLSADSLITDAAAFRATIEAAAPVARERIVTFGIKPDRPEVAYGYILRGAALAEAVFDVEKFEEKPTLEKAEAYLADGRYLWNAGLFIFAPKLLLAEMTKSRDDICAGALAALPAGARTAKVVALDPEAFAACPAESIDYAVMEATTKAAVAPCDIGWADVGSWSEVWRLGARDGDDNLTQGPVMLKEVSSSLVLSGGPTVAAIGVSDLIIVATPDAVVVLPKSRAQEVKGIVESLQRAAKEERRMSDELKALSAGLQDWLKTSALPLWETKGIDRVHGGFIELMGQDGAPVAGPKRGYPQARQLYVFVQAGLMGWDGPWREAVDQGLGFFLRAFPREDGLMRLRVSADGTAEDEAPRLYDQAFALLLLATVVRVLPGEPSLEARAARLRDRLLADRRVAGGGFLEVVGRPYYANPNMHLLEAALAWVAISDDPAWGALADDIAELALAKYIDADGGFLTEYFDETWARTADDDARQVEPGHQFEWAWLLLGWARLRQRPGGLAPAARLYEVGRRGVDQARGIAINALWDDLTVRDATARLWPQTEWIKAAIALARLETPGSVRHAQLMDDAAMAVRALNKYLETPVKGLWRDRYLADGSFAEEPSPATSFYHIVCAITELRTVG